MKAVTTAQIRQLDQRSIQSGIPGEQLMENAGYAVARTAARLLKQRDATAVLLLAGKGNNGGDAIVAARHLAAAGCHATLVLLCRRDELRGEPRLHFQRLTGVDVLDWPCELPSAAVIVDGLLGTGLTGEVREPYASVIKSMNASGLPILAIDVPSGLHSDTGDALGVCGRAEVTVTMGLPKIGLLKPAAADYVGRIEVADIGFPAELIEEIQTEVELLTAADVAPLLPRRHRAAHKGDFGHLLVVAGSEGYTGAPVITAHAAARSGVGLVTLAVPRNIYPMVAANCPPEIMPRPLEETKLGAFDAVAMGPGVGAGFDLRPWLGGMRVPAVLDADALNALAPLRQSLPATLVLTPHPGEMGRLIGKSVKEVQANRWEIARRFAKEHRVTLVLKGAGTVVTDSSGKLWINSTGNPGMAKGGMGDALTGIIGALLAQGLSPLDAARAGVFLHGRAGDLAVERHGETAMLATDLIACLGQAGGLRFSGPSVR